MVAQSIEADIGDIQEARSKTKNLRKEAPNAKKEAEDIEIKINVKEEDDPELKMLKQSNPTYKQGLKDQDQLVSFNDKQKKKKKQKQELMEEPPKKKKPAYGSESDSDDDPAAFIPKSLQKKKEV